MNEDTEIRAVPDRNEGRDIRPYDDGRFGPDPEPLAPLAMPVRAAITAILIVLAIVSATLVATHFANPETHAATIASLDQKAETVTTLAATSTAVAGAITLIPDDVGTPIANKLVDLSSDFLIVMAAIYLEKYLLTIFSLAAFRILIPAALALIVIGLWVPYRFKGACYGLGVRLVLFGIAVAIVVPASIYVSNMIEQTYAADINQAVASAEEVAELAETEGTDSELAEAEGEAPEQVVIENEPVESENTGFVGGLVDWATGLGSTVAQTVTNAGTAAAETVAGIAETVTSGARNIVELAKNTLNDMIEALAVLIVTNCVIPILVLLFFIWLVNTILGININVPMPGPRGRRRGLSRPAHA